MFLGYRSVVASSSFLGLTSTVTYKPMPCNRVGYSGPYIGIKMTGTAQNKDKGHEHTERTHHAIIFRQTEPRMKFGNFWPKGNFYIPDSSRNKLHESYEPMCTQAVGIKIMQLQRIIKTALLES